MESPKEERHIVVTGAGTGIGMAIALRLAKEGASLSLMARDEGRLELSAEACTRAGSPSVAAIPCDIREGDSVRRAFGRAVEDRGRLTALVANAGIGGANVAGAEDRFHDLVATNLTGSYLCARAAEEHMVAGPGARHIVFIASILARIGVPGYSGYCASKAGVVGLARSLGAELAAANIQVNAICPGWVDTSMAREGLDMMAKDMGVSGEEAYRIAMQAVPMGRMSEPEDVAGMVAWLVSEDARGVTGQGLDMNGGAFMI